MPMRTQVQYSPHDSIVLVAHTGLFVELASRHAAPHVREQQTRLIACSPMHSTPQPYAPRLQVYALHAATMCAHAAPLCVPRCASSSPVSSARSRRGRWRRARWHGSRSTSIRLTLTLSLSLILTLSLTSHPKPKPKPSPNPNPHQVRARLRAEHEPAGHRRGAAQRRPPRLRQGRRA